MRESECCREGNREKCKLKKHLTEGSDQSKFSEFEAFALITLLSI